MLDIIMNDIASVLQIIWIDIMLGLDNAVVIALAVAGLAAHHRKKAMLIGTGGAVLARFALLAIATLLLGVPLLKAVAGLYLLYIGYSLIVGGDDDDGDGKSSDNLWGAVWTIMVADVMMSLDNVMAVAGAASNAGEHAAMFAFIGVALSIPFIVFGASLLTKLIDKYPIITWIGGGVLGWVGLEMVHGDTWVHPFVSEFNKYYAGAVGFFVVVFIAFLKASKKKEVQNVGA